MLPKYDEILYPQKVLSVLYILLLDLHEDVNLVKRQLHMLSSRTDYLHRHSLSSLMVKCLYHLPKGASPQTLQKFVSIAHLFMLLPQVPTLQVVLSHAGSNANIVYGLLVYELNPLVLREHGFKTLQDLLSGKARQGPSEVLVVKQLRLFDKWHFFLHFLQVLRPILVHGRALLLDLGLAAGVLLGGGGLAGGGGAIEGLGGLVDAGMPEVLSVGFGRMVAFGGRVVEEEGGLGAVPSIGFIVFIKFDFQVDLHENNNNSILRWRLLVWDAWRDKEAGKRTMVENVGKERVRNGVSDDSFTKLVSVSSHKSLSSYRTHQIAAS